MPRKKTHEEFVQEVYELVGDEYEVLGKYEGANKKANFRHNICGNEYDVRASKFLEGTRCSSCRKASQTKSHVDFVSEVYQLYKDEYQVLGNYINNRTNIEMLHIVCGCNWAANPTNFLKGSQCPNCYGSKKKTTKEFKEDVCKLVGNEYEVISEYVNAQEKILIKHAKCSHRFSVTPNHFLNGTRCPKCNYSKGEIKIAKWMDEYGLKYKSQFCINKCRHIKPLPFDFAIFDNNDNLTCLIEYDGQGHFQPFRFSKDKEKMLDKLRETQRNDQIKNTYCKENNIRLIRIPYWYYDDIEKILNKLINNEYLEIDETTFLVQ